MLERLELILMFKKTNTSKELYLKLYFVILGAQMEENKTRSISGFME